MCMHLIPRASTSTSAWSYTPPTATAADLIGFHQKMRMHKVVPVQPSCYGSDDAAMLDGFAQFTPAQARGIERTDPIRSGRS